MSPVAAAKRLEEAKAELLERALATGPDDPRLGSLVRRYYRHTAPEDLLGRDPVDVLGAVVSHRRTAQDRPQGTAVVHVFTPSVEGHGWSAGHTVVEIVTDDMPFLVDSVTSCLGREGRSIHLVIHPQFVVQRDVVGALQDVVAVDDEDEVVPFGATAESWMHVEIDRETDDADLRQIEADLQAVLRDVREAVEDWPRMVARARHLADELESAPPTTVDKDEVDESVELLRWLADEHFTFLGYREYVLSDDGDSLQPVAGTGLGIMRADRPASKAFSKLSPEVRARAREPHVLVITKANSRSTVHRSTYLDYVGVKQFDENGLVVGERRFLGLYTSSAYVQSVTAIPVLRRTARMVLHRSGFRVDGHSYKDLMQVLETYPRDELFQADPDELTETALSVLHIQERRQTRLFMRRDRYGRFVSCLVYLPRDRYTTHVRLRLRDVLAEEFGSTSIDYTARVSESVLARLHFVVRGEPGGTLPVVDGERLEARLAEATRSWEDEFSSALIDQVGEEEAARLLKFYAEAFPEAYKEDFPARTGVIDVRHLEELRNDGDLGLNLYEPHAAGQGERRFKIYRRGPAISLSTVLPVLQRMGVEVVDERPYDFETPGTPMWVYDFGLRLDGQGVDAATLKQRFQDAFLAAWSGRVEADGFNALVVSAGLRWRQAMVLRAYAKYLRQTGTAFSQDYLERSLVANVPIARLLVSLFETRFDPAFSGDREARTEALRVEVETALESVTSLDQDRILRSFLALVLATLRTNFFQVDAFGGPKDYVSFKLDPAQVPDLPAPRPRFEIWVYSPRVEGVHLRFGAVARGGLRWSDRREDFRTEVLGLVKAQMVKNAVIVPVGAKGGFVVKTSPDPSVDREGWLAEGIACYRMFISGLLDITDNLIAGEVVPPSNVVRHDGDDTYLVVAADKGTATFSDIANEVAISYGFWLGDAFASGGSAGYDHKAMGITARGAWESVKRHFRELGHDTQTEDFTVVGVGDMSGDVFGNGMLLSEKIRLVAAFDHRHVFLDPNPLAAASYAERKRLFELPRSSWADYDQSLISEGGGIYPRTAKSIPISPQVRTALHLPESVTRMTPAELMRAILLAPVDLLWNGGIGTYVKSSRETNAEVGDKGNDAIRVDGSQLRVRVVGEGGNLGLTQLGRIEAARNGVRLNTDAIDNSAGVDTSDHEVNIKILLDRVVRDGDLTSKQRNALLAEMTDEVGHLVLRDNYEQNILLGNARVQSHSMLTVHKRFIRSLEARGALDRSLEFLPSDAEIDTRHANRDGLSSPEFAVLVAYAKITLTEDLLESAIADEAWYSRVLREYFPDQLTARFDALLDSHPLRRQLVITGVVNDMVNRGGITFAFRAGEETGAGPVEVARAYTVAREVFDLPAFWRKVEALDNQVPTAAQCALFLESRRLLDRATRWVLTARGGRVDVGAEIAHFLPEVERLAPLTPDMLRGVERKRLNDRADELQALGAPRELAEESASLLDVYGLLDVVEVARATESDAEDVGRLYFALSERYEVDRMLTRITQLPRDDRWSALARAALRSDLYNALTGMTRRVIETTPEITDPDERIEAWEAQQAEGLARARATLDEISTQEQFDLATLSVALRTIRTLVQQGS
ncbi:MAG: NAD-glutamate dehydrogenase [Frankiales bacterium]|nr:NAD-glutamate dehydrogenase [Frankiales bacterium]